MRFLFGQVNKIILFLYLWSQIKNRSKQLVAQDDNEPDFPQMVTNNVLCVLYPSSMNFIHALTPAPSFFCHAYLVPRCSTERTYPFRPVDYKVAGGVLQ